MPISSQICPHMLYNKCYQQRIRSIPVTIFPDPTIDSFTNINVKCGNPYKSNIPTVAYEKFSYFKSESNDQRNFVNDFYMENRLECQTKMNNNIVEQLKEEMYQNSAYVLAEGATKDYQQFQMKRKRAITTAQQRAKSISKAHFQHQKQVKQKDFEQNSYWLKKLFRKLQQVAKHIVHGNGIDEKQKQRQFLLSKSHVDAKYLSQIKVSNPKNAYEILQQLKILMMKKKNQFSDARQQQQINKSVSMSYTSQASQNTSQGSMLSQATSLNQTNLFGEQQLVNKFWNFNQLQKKWNLSDLQDVKMMIRRMITKKCVFNAELELVKNKIQAKKNDQILMKKLGKQIINKKMQKNPNKNKNVKQSKKKIVQKVIQKKPLNIKKTLNKNQQLAKQSLLNGGRFDAVGQKFMRNKSYSEVFRNKQNQLKVTFDVNVNEKQQLTTINNTNIKNTKTSVKTDNNRDEKNLVSTGGITKKSN